VTDVSITPVADSDKPAEKVASPDPIDHAERLLILHRVFTVMGSNLTLYRGVLKYDQRTAIRSAEG